MNEPVPPKKNQRAFSRRLARPSVKVTCHRGSSGLGPNLAKRLLDVSEFGVRLIVNVPLKVGEEMSITLMGVLQMRPVAVVGTVVWLSQTADGDYQVGVKLEKALSHENRQLLT